MTDHIFYMLGNIPQTSAIIFMFCNVGKPKRPFWFLLTLCSTGFYTAYLVGALLFHPTLGNIPWNIARNLPLILSLFIFFKDSILKKCLMYLGLQLIMMTGSVILNPVFLDFYDVTYNEIHYPCPMQAIGTLSYTDYHLFVTLLVIEWSNRRKKVKWKNTSFCIFMSILLLIHFVFICFCMADRDMPANYEMALMQWSFQMIIICLIIAQYYSNKRNHELMLKNEEYELMKLKKRYTYEYYQLANKRYEDVSKIRHDLHNEIRSVKALIAYKDYSEAERIIQQLQDKLDNIGRVEFCEDPIINSVLAVKVEEAQQHGIRSDIILHSCAHLPFESYDICSVFSNLYDNAITECEKLDIERPNITIRTSMKNEYFVIKFSNTTNRPDQTFSHRLPASMKKGKGHGLGLSIVSDITKKYKGFYHIYIKKHEFFVILYMKIK